MHFIGVMLRRELLVLPRRRHFYLRRCAIPALGGAIIVFGYLLGQVGSSGSTGLVIFNRLGMLVLAVACIIGPYNAASRLLQEREDYTLGLLLLSDVRPGTLLVGVLLATFLASVLSLVAILPLLLLGVSLGGVTLLQLLRFVALLLTTVYVGAGLGLSLGATVRRKELLYGTILLAAALLFVVVPLAGRSVLGANAAVLSPFAVFSRIVQDQSGGLIFAHLALALATGTVLLLPAAFLLRRRVLDDAAPRVIRRRRVGAMRLERRSNPLLWRDFHYEYGGWRGMWYMWLVPAVVYFICAPLIVAAVAPPGQQLVEQIELLAIWYSVLAGVIAAFGFILRCGRTFARERDVGTLGLLLTSDLPAQRIVNGKVAAVYLSLAPWLATVVVGPLAVMTIAWWEAGTGASDPVRAVLVTSGMMAIIGGIFLWWYAFSGIVLWLALYLDTRSAVQAYGILAAGSILGPVILAMMSMGIFFIPGALLAGWLLRRDVVSRLRQRFGRVV